MARGGVGRQLRKSNLKGAAERKGVSLEAMVIRAPTWASCDNPSCGCQLGPAASPLRSPSLAKELETAGGCRIPRPPGRLQPSLPAAHTSLRGEFSGPARSNSCQPVAGSGGRQQTGSARANRPNTSRTAGSRGTKIIMASMTLVPRRLRLYVRGPGHACKLPGHPPTAGRRRERQHSIYVLYCRRRHLLSCALSIDGRPGEGGRRHRTRRILARAPRAAAAEWSRAEVEQSQMMARYSGGEIHLLSWWPSPCQVPPDTGLGAHPCVFLNFFFSGKPLLARRRCTEQRARRRRWPALLACNHLVGDSVLLKQREGAKFDAPPPVAVHAKGSIACNKRTAAQLACLVSSSWLLATAEAHRRLSVL